MNILRDLKNVKKGKTIFGILLIMNFAQYLI